MAGFVFLEPKPNDLITPIGDFKLEALKFASRLEISVKVDTADVPHIILLQRDTMTAFVFHNTSDAKRFVDQLHTTIEAVERRDIIGPRTKAWDIHNLKQ
jgi:hypothetical protein